jgi:mannose-6-phosphate isomerase-like protein (cupin superfamily)
MAPMPSLVGLVLDSGDVLIKFLETAAETGGALHAQEARYIPHSKYPPYHCHPQQEERFQLLEGGLEFTLADEQRIVRAGDEVAIARGVHHKARNPFAEPAIVRWETRPAMRSAEMYRDLYTAAARHRGKPPLHEAAAILREYRHEFRLARPPALIQTIVFSCLAPFGRSAVQRG